MPVKKKPTKYFDVDTRPVAPIPAEPAVAINPIARRRNYAHDFSAGRQLKKIINAKGQPVWRRVPDSAIVFYGKQFTHRRTATTSSVTGKKVFIPFKNKKPTE